MIVKLTSIDIRDGTDFAYIFSSGVLMTTVPQTFTFDPADETRTATLSMFLTSVFGTTSGGGFRPSAIALCVPRTIRSSSEAAART